MYTSFFNICIGSASGPAVDTDNVVTVKKKEECAKVVTAKQILTKKVNTQENHLIMVLVYNKVSFQRFMCVVCKVIHSLRVSL